jgi:hypothetical protein
MNAHFAQIETGTVVWLVVTSYDTSDNADTFCNDERMNAIGVLGEWRQYSPTGAYRGKTPVVGDLFDEVADQFVSPVS